MTLEHARRAPGALALITLLVMVTVGLDAQGTPAPKPAPRQAAPAQRKPAPAKPAPRTNTAPPKAATPAPPAPKPVPTALKIRTRHIANAQISEDTAYYAASRQRYQFPGLATVVQCDLSRTLQVNDRAKRYLVQPNGDAAPAQQTPAAPDSAPQAKTKSGVVTYTITTSDTGERKDMLGRSALHLVVTTRKQPSAEACDKTSQTITVDGWFIDLPPGATACTSGPAERPAAQSARAECTDKVETVLSGGITPGFALESTTTIVTGEAPKNDKNDADTLARSVMRMEVLELQQEPAPETLFDVPREYTEVKTYAELLVDGSGMPASGSSVNDALTTALLGSVADGSRQVAPKTPGSVRIGIGPVANPTGRDVSALGMQSGLVAGLSRAPYEAVPLVGTTPAELAQDARAKNADYVLTSALTTLKSSKPSRAGGVLKKISGESQADEVHDARVDVKLFTLDALDKPASAGSGKANSGGGFSVGSAFRLAAFAGQMYLGMMSGGMLNMNGMPGLANFGGGGRGGFTNMMMGPGMGMAMSVMSQAPPSSGAAGEDTAAIERTVQDAVGKASDDLLDELKKKKR